MIGRREILDMAETFSLLPQVVEKDYVIGWVLAGIYRQIPLAENWIFKGGTCLKKCFFETYRFSEDLDFTLTDHSHIDRNFLMDNFREIGEWVYEQAGIEIPERLLDFDIFKNPRGTVSCQGKLSYRGPIAPRSGALPRIKLDLTSDELLVLPPVERVIVHDYSDVPDKGIVVLCYAYEEAFAEKVRALGDRTRPRDLYDVINLYRNAEARPQAAVLFDVLQQKCKHRKLPIPTLGELEIHRGEVEGSWQPMLGHQLQMLPPMEGYWETLSEFFSWLQTGMTHCEPAAYRMATGESLFTERTLHLPVQRRVKQYLEIIRFAATNRLCVDLKYKDSIRRIEPYSLRRTQDGNIVLHAEKTIDGEHRCYRVDRIEGAQVTKKSFNPRFAVELNPKGMLVIPPSATRAKSSSSSRLRPQAKPSTAWSSGQKYIYECTYCKKHFTRMKATSRLNPHKNKYGFPCPGRIGFLVHNSH